MKPGWLCVIIGVIGIVGLLGFYLFDSKIESMKVGAAGGQIGELNLLIYT
jgi:hypothetical protein